MRKLVPLNAKTRTPNEDIRTLSGPGGAAGDPQAGKECPCGTGECPCSTQRTRTTGWQCTPSARQRSRKKTLGPIRSVPQSLSPASRRLG